MNNLDGVFSLLIACIEIVLLINLLIFAEKNRRNFLVFLIIFLLAGYQVFEFLICGPSAAGAGAGMKSSFMAYLAFVDISFLPPLSFLLVFSFTGIKNRAKYLIFLPAIFFAVYYSSVINQFAVVKCTIFYAAYNYPLGFLYGLFYYLPILFSFILLYIYIKNKEGMILKQTKILITGYYFIVIPAVASFLLFLLNLPGLLDIIESFLCKFAFGFVISLSFFALNNRNE